MIPYILHVTVILTICFLFYKLFLQKATFYGLNRWTLLSCLVLSFVLPLLPAPNLLPAKPTVSASPAISALPIDRMPQATASASITERSQGIRPQHTAARKTHSTTIKQPITTASPDDATLPPATVAILPLAPSPSSHPFTALFLRGLQLLSYIYLIGLLVFGLKFILQILLLCYRSFTCPVNRDGRFRIVQTRGDRGPCTFANTIFINPALYDPETFQQILVHEKIHVSGGHTLDILLAELAVVFQWFNPFVWLYRREVENNLEFLTDRSVLEHPDIERLAYQLSLVRVSAPHLPFSITNNYNQSLLKRRIVMMNSQHSARHTIWRYFVLLPVLTVLVCVLNKPAALGQTTAAKTDQSLSSTAKTQTVAADTVIRPAKATADMAGTIRVNAATSVAGSVTTIRPSTSVVSADGASAEPAIATTVSASPDAPSTVTTVTISDTTPLHFSGDNLDLRQGSWFLTVDSDKMEFILRAQDGENSWQYDITVNKAEISPYPGMGSVEFRLVREAGTMTFKGQFDGGQGFGRFQFQPDEAYYDAIGKMGVEDLDNGRQHSFFSLNIKKEFVSMLNRNGYTPIEQRDVIGLAARKIDEPFLKYWKNSGIAGAGEVRNLMTLKSLHIEPDYVEELKKAGYTQLDVRQLIGMKRQHIDGNYVRAMSSGSATPVSPEELVSYKLMQIDSGYLASLKKVGYDHLDRSEIRSLYNTHVTADYIKGFQDAGFSAIPARTLVTLKLQDISPDFAKNFRNLGYADIDLNRLAFLRRAGITPEFIAAFHKIGYDNVPVNLLYSLKNAGVDADYVARMKEKGLNSPDLMKYVQLKRDFN
jgi:hypothetical protein